MKKSIWVVIYLLFSFVVHNPKTFAQVPFEQPATKVLSTNQQEKEKFLHGFYISYMSSIIYNVEGLEKILKDKYVERRLIQKSSDTDVDILLDAQDCIEENLKTLKVTAINDFWYRVSFLWSSPYPQVPTRQHILLVKVVRGKQNYKIQDIKVEK